FCRLERDLDFHDDLHGRDGPIPVRRFPRQEWLPPQEAFVAACRAEGFAESPDHNHPTASGVGPLPLNTLDGIRWSTNVGYLNPARHRPNLTLMANCMAEQILFEGRRATGVLIRRGAETLTFRGEEVILSAGAIGSPHLLMLSGVGPADQLASAGIPPKV